MLRFCIILFVLLSWVKGYTQGSKHGGNKSAQTQAAAPSTASSPAASGGSGTNQLITGFHYRLRSGYAIKYNAIFVDSVVNSFTNIPVAQLDSLPTQVPVKYKDILWALRPSQTVIDSIGKNKNTVIRLDSVQVSVSYTVQMVDKPSKPVDPKVSAVQLVTAITRNIYVDTLLRYWVIRQKDDKYQNSAVPAWASATQLDSGKIQINFKNGGMLVKQACSNCDAGYSKYDTVKRITYNYEPGKPSHYAIPVSPMDSAENFSLQVQRKVFIRDPTYFIKLRYSLWQYGPITVPFKYRWGNSRSIGGYTPSANTNGPSTGKDVTAPSESSGNLNLALYVGRKIGSTRFYYDQQRTHNSVAYMFSAFAGTSLVTLNATNVLYNTDLSRQPSQIIAVSLGGACSVEWQSFSFGLFVGSDLPLEKNSPWVYKHLPWVGFGIGFNLGMLTSATSQH